MTKHDAIKHLSYKIAYCKTTWASWADRVNVDALELAVRALAEPERKQGKWINCGIIYAGTAGYTVFRCSECNEPNDRAARFCPNCGAEMENSK